MAHRRPREHDPRQPSGFDGLLLSGEPLLPDDRRHRSGRGSALVPVSAPGLPLAGGPHRGSSPVPRVGGIERDSCRGDAALPRRGGCRRRGQRGADRADAFERGGTREPCVAADAHTEAGRRCGAAERDALGGGAGHRDDPALATVFPRHSRGRRRVGRGHCVLVCDGSPSVGDRRLGADRFARGFLARGVDRCRRRLRREGWDLRGVPARPGTPRPVGRPLRMGMGAGYLGVMAERRWGSGRCLQRRRRIGQCRRHPRGVYLS